MFPDGPLTITPLGAPVTLEWDVPGSKSITNRALVLAALAAGESTLTGVLQSDDTLHMRRALEALGIEVNELDPTTLRVRGGTHRLRQPTESLFVGNSGTTVRFLTALAALVPGTVELDGDEHMQRRPIADLVQGLQQLGVSLECPSGCPPLIVRGTGLPGGSVTMRGDRSSQYFSAMLMAAAAAAGPIQLLVEGELVSRPYVDITLAMMRAFGGEARNQGQGFVVEPTGGYRPTAYAIEPDASSASYAFATAVATGGRVSVEGLGTESLQGDYGFCEVLERAGAVVERGATRTSVSAGSQHRGVDVDMHHISDTVMTLAALAPLADGPTTIRNVANIRIKETDRLLATVNELKRLGQHVEHGDDWLRIAPRPIVPATVHCYSDHRMAMSFAILGLARPGVSIGDPACVAKTYPGFWDALKVCYANVGRAAPW
ncbi:MAG TPA: 3-phosphoshikimate 1-carboxyvinyltransferase [Polyangiaceae bacterium]|nr:3-phosphoshikimate 1-carboxyvinyltransferase [Polyangiaceae bacterium]